jgi:anti-sigma factor RsiW
LGRPFDKHIDVEELNALVPSDAGQELLGPDVREAERHVQSCVECSRKVSLYRQLVTRSSNVVVSEVAAPGTACPQGRDVDWHEVAAGLWPELKAKQLIMHAALCDHCGPLLRAATSMDDDPSSEEEKLLAQLKAPSRPDHVALRVPSQHSRRGVMRWLVPALAVIIVGLLIARLPSSQTPLSGSKYAEFAASAHEQHAEGNLALDVRSESQQALNQWFKTKLPFELNLPVAPAVPGEERPYHLEGARLVQVGGKPAAFIAYQLQTGPASMMVTPESVAVASGGVKVAFKKVSFHYRTVKGYKVVTWSLHGLTYALVSQEGNGTQQSCMVCHSAMRDRDLSHTPTPLHPAGNATERVLQ